MYHYIYLKQNQDWEIQNKIKYGYVYGNDENLINRLKDNKEEHSELSYFTQIYQIEKTEKYNNEYQEIDKLFSNICKDTRLIHKLETIYQVKLPLFYQLYSYLIHSKTKITNEFVSTNGIETINSIIIQEFPLLGLNLIKIYSQQEIDIINHSSYHIEYQKNDKHISLLEENYKKIRNKSITQIIDKYHDREYQEIAIKYIKNELITNHKLYLKLPTGGGKSYISYQVVSKFMPDVFIILSPRININSQNVKSDYLELLNYQYNIYDFSSNKSFGLFYNQTKIQNKNILLIGCYQSANNIYQTMIQYQLNNIFIWFDEAHWAIESWVEQTELFKKYLLNNTQQINKRLFTSASPDIDTLHKYKEVFGEIYEPIKINELIRLNYLCPIKPHIFSIDENNYNMNYYNLHHFTQYNRSHGFSFHNLQKNAFELFYLHYLEYKQDKTKIKPYLLVGDDYQIEEKYNIQLSYNFREIKDFELNKNSIGYVVQKYTMGYDFNQLDYIIFSDPKLSYQDIIQCIGRGTRPDNKNKDGKNIEKELILMIPIFISNIEDFQNNIETKNKYSKIIKVLLYLINEVKINFNDIKKDLNYIRKYNQENQYDNSKDYNGLENIEARLLELIQENKKWKYKEFITYLKKELNPEITINQNINHYQKLVRDNPELNLPISPFTLFSQFSWSQLYIDNQLYYNKYDCIEKIKELKKKEEIVTQLEEYENPEEYLHSIDNKIPNITLSLFYGSPLHEFY